MNSKKCCLVFDDGSNIDADNSPCNGLQVCLANYLWSLLIFYDGCLQGSGGFEDAGRLRWDIEHVHFHVNFTSHATPHERCKIDTEMYMFQWRQPPRSKAAASGLLFSMMLWLIIALADIISSPTLLPRGAVTDQPNLHSADNINGPDVQTLTCPIPFISQNIGATSIYCTQHPNRLLWTTEASITYWFNHNHVVAVRCVNARFHTDRKSVCRERVSSFV